ncbi:MAG TPA: hypothetical protein VMH00_00380 [Candidatus Limnocylindrales bacterium]|nr:hypothetical protein [Candidatus Limnocylindrales bacterium]
MAVADIQLLDEGDRDLTPNLDHAGDQARPVQAEILVEANWESDRPGRIRSIKRRKMSVLERKRRLVAGAGVQADPENLQKVDEPGSIYDAEAKELVNARNGVLVLQLGEPGVRDVVLFVAKIVGDLTAEFLNLAGSYTQSIAELP